MATDGTTPSSHGQSASSSAPSFGPSAAKRVQGGEQGELARDQHLIGSLNEDPLRGSRHSVPGVLDRHLAPSYWGRTRSETEVACDIR